MESQVLINEEQFALILDRLAHQLLEHHDFTDTDLVGLQPISDTATFWKSHLKSLFCYDLINIEEYQFG